MGWLFTHSLGKLAKTQDFEMVSESWFEEWHLGKLLCNTYQLLGKDDITSEKVLTLTQLLINQQLWYRRLQTRDLTFTIEDWLSNQNCQVWLGINRYKEILWFNKESFEEFVWYMTVTAVIVTDGQTQVYDPQFIERVIGAYDTAQKLIKAMEKSEYQVTKLLEAVKKQSAKR